MCVQRIRIRVAVLPGGVDYGSRNPKPLGQLLDGRDRSVWCGGTYVFSFGSRLFHELIVNVRNLEL